MGEARDVMDRLTEAVTHGDLTTVAELYAEDAVAFTPDEGELHGRDAIVEYRRTMTEAIPDATFTPLQQYEADDTAIDEGVFSGVNTGPIPLPDGETLPATGRKISIRGTDLATVKDGRITSYRLYFDQMLFLDQLGLLPQD
ncbi:ester cyclase [Streptomyces roseicoloratus]|uniref:Ester cyclase n=1 Tax=Streptomyces roseicoloratus TaxID=2508722 RepID=A0ABY9RQY8_9ACTN|nr:nuclear transport factor 2 family protein [Streptomyces roseicoloratus]WMX43649.1 ester cyclase [Streptomyces roseicoloratus]